MFCASDECLSAGDERIQTCGQTSAHPPTQLATVTFKLNLSPDDCYTHI